MSPDVARGPCSINSSAVELEAVLAQHASPQVLSELSEGQRGELGSVGSTSIQAVVVVGDLRLSGYVLRESANPSLYARFVVGFTEAIRGLSADCHGWFDKFTGDGFVAFWPYPDDVHIPTGRVSAFCQAVLPASEMLVANLRRNSRNFPVGVGLALGMDAGPCELVRIGGAITVVGSPIVGASRMCSSACAGETLVNVHLGNLLEHELRGLESGGLKLRRTVARTKEYPKGQEAYHLTFPRAGPE